MYIRTMSCIYEVEKEYELKNLRYFEDGKYYKIKSDIAYIDIPEKLVEKTADNLADLCDEFVLYYRECQQDLIPWATYERNSESWENNKKDLIRELNNKDRKAQVYGAIWTDKGLIYVAIMNSEGVLCLI